MLAISILAMSASTREAIIIAVFGAMVGSVLFELIRDRLMKAIRAAPKAIGRALNANVSKPIVLIPTVVIGVVIAALLLHSVGLYAVA